MNNKKPYASAAYAAASAVLIAIGANMLMDAPADAYSLEGPVWRNSSATFLINTQYGPADSLSAFQSAMKTWSNVTGSSLVLYYGGLTASHAYGTNNGENIADFGPLSSQHWGRCFYWYKGNYFLDADVRLNRDKPWGQTPSADVETVALHEFGHALGLGHTSDQSAIMYSRVDRTKCTLAQDDINGLTALYSGTYITPALLAGDFNGDSRDDIGYINRQGYIYYTTDLTDSWTKIGSNRFTAAAAGDFNDDGSDDVAGINFNGYILYTEDLNTWTKIGSNKFLSLLGGDFNADGASDDIAAINLNRYILYTSDRSQWRKIGANKFDSFVAGDFDADGFSDNIAGINLNQYMLYSADLISWEKIGSNRFNTMVSGDFDGDGASDDIAAINLNRYILYTSDRSQWRKIGANKFGSLTRGDFNGDGTDDIAAINLQQYALYSTDRSAWQKIGTNRLRTLICGDFDGDGARNDLAALNVNNHVLYTTDLSTWTRIEKP